MYIISNQKDINELLQYDSLDLNQLGINMFGDKLVLLKGSFFEIDCASRLIKSLPKIDFIGETNTVVQLRNAEKGYSHGSDPLDFEQVPLFLPNYGLTFSNVFVTADTYHEILFPTRETMEEWKDTRFDTSMIGIYILTEETQKVKDMLESYDVTGVLSGGDHVIVDRGLYTHHGVYIGDNKLIHYSGEPGVSGKVTEITLEKFAKHNLFWVYEHEDALPAKEIVSRAKSRLGEENYDLEENNCEHFAHWCCSGQSWSNQMVGLGLGKVIGYAVASLANDGGAKKYKLRG